MNLITMAIVAALVFGVCFLVDRAFSRAFRSKAQHKSGLAVRVSKRYGTFGILALVLGIASILTGTSGSALLIICGCLLILLGIGLICYYVSFGVFYDTDTFLVTTFGKSGVVYSYKDIQTQQLYMASGNTVVELHMADGHTIQLHAAMDGMYPFLDHAFSAWLRQTGKTLQDCPFHDPANSCWFPPAEG